MKIGQFFKLYNKQQYFTAVKMIICRLFFYIFFSFFAQNIDCGYTLEPPHLTSTHNLCFRAKIRKNVYPCTPQFYYIEVGCKGVFVTRTCFLDAARFVSD